MADFTLQALHDELVNNPASLGYGNWPEADNDAEVVALINALTGPGAGTITRKLIDRNEIIYGIEPGECIQVSTDTAPDGVFSDTERWYLSMLLRDQTVDANDEEVFAGLLRLFPTEGARPGFRGTSRANIQSTLQRTGSRAEVLWGEGKIVTISEVGHAANL